MVPAHDRKGGMAVRSLRCGDYSWRSGWLMVVGFCAVVTAGGMTALHHNDVRRTTSADGPASVRRGRLSPTMSPDCQFWWNWWVTAAVAVATFLPVLVALFGEQWRASLFAPRLQLRLLGSAGEKTQLNTPNGVHVDDVRYYYVEVS